MTYELGRAQFILDFEADQALQDQAVVYNEVTKKAKEVTKILAQQLKVRQSDVKGAASVLIAEEKKTQAEIVKAQKAAAAEQKKTTQETIKYNKQQYEEDLRNWQATLKARDKALKDQADFQKQQTQAMLRYNQQVYREEQRIAKEKEREAKRQEQLRNRQSPLPNFIRGIPGDLATIAGFGAIASGAILVRQALITLTEATLKQQQAERSLQAAFGDSARYYKENAGNLAKQFNLVSSEVEQASARFGVLRSQTALTSEQITKLNQVAIDNQAAFGGDLAEAHRALAGAILGETEAYEKYGVVLQEGVLKSSSLLTEEERKRFTVMSESEKQMIRYRIIMQEAARTQGAAAKASQEAKGGFDALNRSVAELAKTLGKSFIDASSGAARELSSFLNMLNSALKEREEYSRALARIRDEDARLEAAGQRPGFLESFGPFTPQGAERIARARAELQAYDKEVEERARARANEQRLFDDEQAKKREARDKEEAALRQQQERAMAMIEYAHKQEIRNIEERIKAAEFERQNKLDVLEDQKDNELRVLDEIEEARKRASELELARIQNQRDQAIKASEDRQQAEEDRLDAELDAIKAASEQQIRQLEIEKERRQEANESTRTTELTRLEQEKEARVNTRRREDRQIADSIQTRERILEDAHKKELARIELESEALRDKYDKQIDNIDKQVDKEEDRHTKRLREIDDERDKTLKALDQEIEKTQKAEQIRDNARRRRDLQQKLQDAQLDLRRATGTQNPVAREQAQAKLVSAIRIGDPQAIAKAEKELLEIVGQGVEAIAKAQREVANLQEDLRDQDIKQTEAVAKEKLEIERQRIDDETEEEKRKEQDRNTRRKRQLEADKDSEKQRLDAALRRLERTKEREDKAFNDAKRQLDDLTTYNARKLEDRRQTEDAAHERAIEAAQTRYRQEQIEIKNTYDSEETGSIPAVRRATKAATDNYQLQQTEVKRRYQAERDEIKNTYDNPETGLIAQHRRMEQDAQTTYQNIVKITREKYEDARKEVERAYVAGDGKSGIIDKLQVLKEETDKKLEEVKLAFEQHKKDLTDPGGVITSTWEEAIKAVDAYFNHIKERTERTRRENQIPVNIPYPSRDPDSGGGSGSGGGGRDGVPQDITGTSTLPPEPESSGMDPDSISNMFTTNFGYQAPYTGFSNPAGPGWSGVSYRTGGPSHHKGVDLILPGQNNGYGKPIPAFHPGTVLRASNDPKGGGNMLIIQDDTGRTHWYMHLKDTTVDSGTRVNRGDIIGHMGNTPPPDTVTHLHYEVRSGDNDGPQSLEELRNSGIDPRPYIRGRDDGFRFNNPTVYMDLRTKERGVIAEYGPEMLLGRAATQQLQSMGVTRNLARPAVLNMDYNNVGSFGARAQTVLETVNNHTGDQFVYNGVAPEDVVEKWRADQRRRNLLRGIGGLTR